VGNYVTDNPSNLGKYVTADSPRGGCLAVSLHASEAGNLR
jgi:hypothetical protein